MVEIDGREKGHYSAQTISKRLLDILFNQHESFLSVEDKENMVGNTLAYFLKKANLGEANRLLFDLFHTTYRGKQLKDFTTVGGQIALIIDGTECFESTVRHSENYTTVVRNGITYYQYRLLVASVVNIKTHDTMVVSIEPIINQDGVQKNDCEINAAKRLLERIHSYNSWMRYTIVADGLYTASSILHQIKSYKWEAIISLTDDSMDIYKVADCRFGNRKADVSYIENYEQIQLWRELKPLSEFWKGLNIDIYVGRRRIDATDANGSLRSDVPVRTCFFISTIPLSTENIKIISQTQRARWGIENATINAMKNRYHMKHIFVYQATALVWIFAAIAMNLFTLYRLRNHLVLCPNFKTHAKMIQWLVDQAGGVTLFTELFRMIT